MISPGKVRQVKNRLAQYGATHRGRLTAYFCMEYGLHPLPIYSGGLGILAADTLMSAADKGFPMVAVGILYRDGFYKQEIVDGRQKHPPLSQRFNPTRFSSLIDLQEKVEVVIAGRKVNLRLWEYEVPGIGGNFVPLLLLDSLGFPNPAGFEEITRQLYLSGSWERLCQEMVLGIGGMRTLDFLGLPIAYYHLNEGHAAFATIEYLRKIGKAVENLSETDFQKIKQVFSFTTHTPVPAGFDMFHESEIERAFYDPFDHFLRLATLRFGRDPQNHSFINMAYLAMRFSGVRNGVSRLHAKVSEELFPDFSPIIPITNGVHHLTWVSEPMAELYDKYCKGWRENPARLQDLIELVSNSNFREELWQAHQSAKAQLLARVRRTTGVEMEEEVFTIGFARRFATYKRGDLIFANRDELIRLAEQKGKIQLIFAGKPHPNDSMGKEILARVIAEGKRVSEESKGKIKFSFLPDYNKEIAQDLVAGSDVWLNNPKRPLEASGTSGMKAALNGVPQISTEDGWWVERRGGGWTINEGKELKPTPEDPDLYVRDGQSLYQILAEVIDNYYQRETNPLYLDKMIEAISQNGSYFNTHRMLDDYAKNVWFSARKVQLPTEAEEPIVFPQEKLLALADIAVKIREAEKATVVEEIAAEAMIKFLRRSFRVTRYRVHNEAVRIDRRFLGGEFGKHFFEEKRADFGQTGFANWRELKDFEGEVMGDLLRTRKIQVVTAPERDSRCYRDGKLVSPNPFIMVPEIVNDEIKGVYKIDFRPGGADGGRYEIDFINKLMEHVGKAKARIIEKKCERSLGRYREADKLINWTLTLMTAGGFVDMPNYAVETNRAAFFVKENGSLAGKAAVGETNWFEFQQKLSELATFTYAENIQEVLANYENRSTLASQIKDLRIEINLAKALPGPLLIQFGESIYDPKDFMGSFDARELSQLKRKIEEIFAVEGKSVEEYLLLPAVSESGKHLGLFYLDNVFSKFPLSSKKYKKLVQVFSKQFSSLL